MEDGKFCFFPKDNTNKSFTKSGSGVGVNSKVLFTDCDDVKGYLLNFGKTHRYVRVCVTGYDPSLAEDDALKKDLSDIFRSCGGILRVDFAKDPSNPENDHRCAIIEIFGEHVDEKASQLSGTEFRGRKLVAKALPPLEFTFNQPPPTPFPAQISH